MEKDQTTEAQRRERGAQQAERAEQEGERGAQRLAGERGAQPGDHEPARQGNGDRERRVAPHRRALPESAISMASPFTFMRSFIEDLDRLFYGVSGGSTRMPLSQIAPRVGGEGSEPATWTPALEVFERDGELVVRAEFPGMSKDDIDVSVEEDRLVISGERRRDHEEKREGYYRSERSYGAFQRIIALPEGVDPTRARAVFTNGILEIALPIEQHQDESRHIEIQESAERDAGQKANQTQAAAR